MNPVESRRGWVLQNTCLSSAGFEPHPGESHGGQFAEKRAFECRGNRFLLDMVLDSKQGPEKSSDSRQGWTSRRKRDRVANSRKLQQTSVPIAPIGEY